MELFVTDGAGGTLSLAMEAGDSIALLKAKIQDKLGVPQELQRLALPLDDQQSLASYNIAGGACLQLSLALGAGPQVRCAREASCSDLDSPLQSAKHWARAPERGPSPARWEDESPQLAELSADAAARSPPLEARPLDAAALGTSPAEQLEQALGDGQAAEGKEGPGMRIFVQGVKGRVLRLCVKASDSLGTLKARIAEVQGASGEEEFLYLGTQRLEGPLRSLAECRIGDGATLSLRMAVYVETVRGATPLAFHVRSSDTVDSLKRSIRPRFACRRLFYMDMELEGDRRLSYYGVRPGSWLKASQR